MSNPVPDPGRIIPWADYPPHDATLPPTRRPQDCCYTIGRLPYGGYVVQDQLFNQHGMPLMLFAGELEPCLEFIRGRLTPENQLEQSELKP